MSITLFYGDAQTFGRPAHTQRWVNVLGRVTDASIETHALYYALNDGPTLWAAIGPDGRRLARAGDFNIDIDRAVLRPGPNALVLTLRRNGAAEPDAVKHVTLINTPDDDAPWALPRTIRWADIATPQDAVQIIDGVWALTPEGLRNTEPDYDRIIAIGPVDALTDCEILAPITVNAIHEPGWTNPNSTAPGLGIVHRWTGHSDWPVVCRQPHCGFLPSGAQGWYDWGDAGGALFLMDSRYQFMQRAPESWKLRNGVTYLWRMRLRTAADGCHYSLNVWPDCEPEPTAPMLSGVDAERDPRVNPPRGSLLIVAHHIDATIGDVTVTGV
jgi:hypothetical protein